MAPFHAARLLCPSIVISYSHQDSLGDVSTRVVQDDFGGERKGPAMHLRLWPSAPLGLMLLLALPAAAASASVGVGVQAGPVLLSGSAHPGGTYELQPVYVVNTGTQQESIDIQIERISPGRGRTVPPSWVHVNGRGVSLAGNQSAHIPLQLVVPDTAKAGTYFSDVVVRGTSALAAGRANLRVNAATSIEFTVAPGLAPRPWLSLPGWMLPTLGGLLLLTVAALIFRRSGLRVRIVREPRFGATRGGQVP